MNLLRHQRLTACLRPTTSPVLAVALVLAMLVSFGFAQQAAKPLTNDDVVSMVKSSLPEEVILNALQANDTNFDTSASGLIALKNAGISSKLMSAMLAAAAAKKNPPSSQPAAAGQPLGLSASGNGSAAQSPAAGLAQFGQVMKAMMGGGQPGLPNGGGGLGGLAALSTTASLPAGGMPVVGFLEATGRKDLTPERTFVAQTKSKADSLKNIAVDSATKSTLEAGINQAWYTTAEHMGSGFGGSVASNAIWQTSNDVAAGVLARRFKPSSKYVWALSGVSSSVVASSNLPKFDLSYANLPGVNADEFEPAIVKLSPSNNAWRLVGATNAKSDTVLTTAPEWQVYSSFIEDRVPATVSKVASGHTQISPNAALAAGEYAVVLRPISKAKKFSGAEVAENQGGGLLFNSAWSFSVK